MKRLKLLANKPHRITLDDLSPEKRKKAEEIIARMPQTLAWIEEHEAELLAEAREAFDRIDAQRARIRAAIDQLKAEREARGLTLDDVARTARISRATLSRLENGRNPNPTLNTLQRYAAALGKTVLLEIAPSDA